MKKIKLIAITSFLLVVLATSLLTVSSQKFESSWYNIYAQKTIYKEVMKETCIDSWYEPHNQTTHPERCYEELDYLIPEQQSTGKVIGITDGNEIIYNAHVKGNKVSKWYYDLKDRNYEEFGECMPHEILKGVCEIVK